jgi:hypothetical protein
MGLSKNTRGVSSEVFKIAAAMLIGFAVFAMLVNFALGPKEADAELQRIGATMLNWTQNTSLEIIAYNET